MTGPEHVAIIGAGSVGTALARGMTRAGRAVTLGVREPATRHDVPDGVSVAAPHEAALTSAIVVLAVPVPALSTVVPALRLAAGTVLVDATNAVRIAIPDGHPTVAAHVAALAPETHVVKAFNTIGAEHLDGSLVEDRPVFLPIAGDDQGRPAVVELATAMGFDVADVGGPDAVGLVEAHAQLWIQLAIFRGWGRDFAWSVTRTR